MKKTLSLLLALALVLSFSVVAVPVGVVGGSTATINVSQPVQVTNSTYYERGQSIIYDGSNYWLFYGRSVSANFPYSGGNPDKSDYEIYYKMASSVVGLATASPTLLNNADNHNIFNGELSAATDGGTGYIFVYGAVDRDGVVGGQCDLYQFGTQDNGGTWISWNLTASGVSGVLPGGSAHHAAVNYGGQLWVAWHEASGWKSNYFSGGWSGAKNIFAGDAMGKFYVEGTHLYFVRANFARLDIYEWNGSTWSTSISGATESGALDPTIYKIGSNYVCAYAPWVSPSQWIKAKVGTSLSSLLSSGTDVAITAGGYGSNDWVDMWPTGFTDNSSDTYLFYTSERNPSGPSSEIAGNIWYLKVDWPVTNDHYTYIQNAVDEATSTTINVAAGTYTEQVTIDKSLDLIGAGEGSTTIQAPTSGRSTVSQPNTGYSDIVWDYVVAAYPSSGTIDVKIQGFTVDANGQDGSSTRNFAGVFLRDIGDGTDDGLYSCTVNNFGSYGVSSNYWSGTYGTWMGNYGVIIYDDSELTVDDCDIDDYSVSGISAKGTDVDLTITSNDLDGTDSNYVGLFLRDGVATITDNNIYNHDGVGENIGIYLYDAANGVTIDDSVGANTINDNWVGVFLKGTNSATIDGNTFTDNTHKSIVIQQDSDNNVVKSNTISMASGVDVSSGIYIGSDSGGNVIGGDTAADGNSITMPTSGSVPSHMPYAIHVGDTDTGDVTIKHNTITGAQRAIQFDGGPGHSGTNTISYNTMTSSPFGGIMSSCHGNFVISDNTITGTDRPLEFNQGSWGSAGNGDITITGNTLSSTAYDVICAASYASMTVHYNNIEYLGSFGCKGVNNLVSTLTVDARYNWWGAASGPSGGVNDPVTGTPANGSGDSVSANVRFDPWIGLVSVPTTTGTGTASFAPSAGNITQVAAVATPPGCPVVLPHGMFSFNITGLTPGQNVTVTIKLPAPVPVGSVWWKYQGGSWYSLPIGDDDGDNTITVTLKDGLFPQDAVTPADGVIIDPGGPGKVYRGLIIRSTEGGRVTKPGEGHHLYEPGTVVKLVATPDDGYRFVEWTHDVRRIDDVNAAETTITMDWSYVIIANFVTVETATTETSVKYELNVSSTIGGSVASPGEGTFPYIEGTLVSLVANPDAGYKFVNWTGDSITNVDSATVTVTMNGDHAVQANFEFEQTTTTDPTEGSSSGPLACFIATAAYGTPTAEQIDVLREFRDVVLLENSVGSEFVALYYKLSPPVADFIAGNNFLRTLVRELVVDPVVWIVEATGAIWRD